MIGMSVVEFESLTFRQFQNAVSGYEKRVGDLEQRKWERARWQVWATLAVHQPKNKPLKLEDIALF